MKRFFILLAFILCGIMGTVSAQNQTVVNMGGSTTSVAGCNFVIYDHGGETGDYGPNRNDMLTIHSTNTSMTNVQIKIIINGTDIHPSDTLFIYDGETDTDSLLIASINNDALVGIGGEVTLTATVMNPSGAITLKFVSDSVSEGGGFQLETSCVQSCQRVSLAIDSLLSSHYPHLDEDGFYYIDLCGHDTLHLVVNGVYVDNDYNYHQEDANTLFKWDLGVEYLEGEGLTTIDYFFEHGRGYDVSLSNVDSAGCENMNPLVFRIRTSDNPIRHVQRLPPMCSGDEITVTASYSNLSVVQIDSIYSEQLTTLAVLDTVFIPDGVECNGICAFESPVTFTAFAPSARIQSEDDIWYVRAKLEHTWIGDIYVALTCPPDPVTGVRKSAKILKKYGNQQYTQCTDLIPPDGYVWNVTSNISTSVDFGAALHTDTGDDCDPNTNPMGTPWNYCWSNNSSNGYQYANGHGYVYETDNHGHHHSGSVDSSNMTNMTNIYHPDESFASLIGCPMNGTWSITVIDSWYGDNGYITEWEMALDPSLVPQDWSYTVFVDTVFVTGPGADGSSVIPSSGGDIDYLVHVIDDLGCEYDTTIVLDVIERPNPNLGEDITICHGDLYELQSHYDHPYSFLIWNTGERTPDIYVNSAGEYSVRITATNEDGVECTGSDTINVIIVPKPIPDFYTSDTSGCAPLNIHLTNTTIATDTTTMTYLWACFDENMNKIFTSDKPEPDFIIDQDGKYAIFLLTTTDRGCRDSVIKWNYINVNYQPAAEFDALPEVALWSETDGSIFFQVQGDTTAFGNSLSFNWDFGDGSSDSSSYALEHSYSSWGDYDVTLSMYTPEGCNSSITHTVTLEADLVFPNVITPNGDGVNDVFAIGNLNTSMNDLDPDKYRNNELTIYDRWGKQVYHAENYDTFMDMTGERGNGIIIGDKVFDAAKVTDGSYFYTFYYKGKFKTVNYHGTLQIIRER
jgi:gliding motility-associated-like protein